MVSLGILTLPMLLLPGSPAAALVLFGLGLVALG